MLSTIAPRPITAKVTYNKGDLDLDENTKTSETKKTTETKPELLEDHAGTAVGTANTTGAVGTRVPTPTPNDDQENLLASTTSTCRVNPKNLLASSTSCQDTVIDQEFVAVEESVAVTTAAAVGTPQQATANRVKDPIRAAPAVVPTAPLAFSCSQESVSATTACAVQDEECLLRLPSASSRPNSPPAGPSLASSSPDAKQEEDEVLSPNVLSTGNYSLATSAAGSPSNRSDYVEQRLALQLDCIADCLM